ncbi:hypothetical protein, partial [Mesorhizobium sp. M4B.F.Ca.ET.169.01.1.1]|uniref:hypothetical protein n=1 Tax=Mesorhizobium sp. M4B.F.Ca.ET.169.01.1.1 TaxID=2563949 RepID=UPI001AEE86C5
MTLADEIDKARRRVTRGERRIAEQRGRILELQVRHHSTRKAHDFLQLLESLVDFHRMHLDRQTAKAELASIEHDDWQLRAVS